MTNYRIIPLAYDADDYGVYADRGRGIYGTAMVYRGTMVECRAFVRGDIPNDKEL